MLKHTVPAIVLVSMCYSDGFFRGSGGCWLSFPPFAGMKKQMHKEKVYVYKHTHIYIYMYICIVCIDAYILNTCHWFSLYIYIYI